MLVHLKIENFAIITHCELEFSDGFSIFSGETGAGKSIIVDAIGLILGQSSTETMIQSGQDSATIEGQFKLDTIPEVFADYIDPGDPLIVWRKLSRNKENSTRINGHAVPLKILKQGMSQILNIIGQHEHMHLIDAGKQLTLVDQADPDLILPLKKAYQTQFQAFTEIAIQLAHFKQDLSDQHAKIEFLKFQCQDIESQNFEKGEEEKLLEKKKIVQNHAKFHQYFTQSLEGLENLEDQLVKITKPLKQLDTIDPRFKPMLDHYTQQELAIKDHQSDLLDHIKELDTTQDTDIDSIESRLDTIFKYKTKYNQASIDALIEFYTALSTQKHALENRDQSIQNLETQYQTHLKEVQNSGKKLHQARQTIATKVAAQVTDCLKKLHFLDPQFTIEIHPLTEPALSGMDKVEFLISPNSGETPKPMGKIASGGELSRIMLAIKTIFLHSNPIPTLIFDEIDTGIGGITANTVGDFLKQIAHYNQVLCVTHLPQIARLADHHYVVEKFVLNQRTQTKVSRLTPTDVKAEIARMVGGEVVLNEIK